MRPPPGLIPRPSVQPPRLTFQQAYVLPTAPARDVGNAYAPAGELQGALSLDRVSMEDELRGVIAGANPVRLAALIRPEHKPDTFNIGQ